MGSLVEEQNEEEEKPTQKLTQSQNSNITSQLALEDNIPSWKKGMEKKKIYFKRKTRKKK